MHELHGQTEVFRELPGGVHQFPFYLDSAGVEVEHGGQAGDHAEAATDVARAGIDTGKGSCASLQRLRSRRHVLVGRAHQLGRRPGISPPNWNGSTARKRTFSPTPAASPSNP